MSELVDKIKMLESKAESFDGAVDRIMALKSVIEDVRTGDASPINLSIEVERLIEFYEFSSTSFINKVDAEGYSETILKKYTSSTFNDKLIDKVFAFKNGNVFVAVKGEPYDAKFLSNQFDKSGLYFVGCMSSDVNCYQGADYILCDVASGMGGRGSLNLEK
tara:strand:+ start:3098 stop:3583 length:486 start_codon:yes stop_codon:yes gene_type:complete